MMTTSNTANKSIKQKQQELTGQEKESNHIVISGTAFWASVHKPRQDSDKYQMDLAVNDATAAKLKALGVSIKSEKPTREDGTPNPNYGHISNDRGGKYVTIKRNGSFTDKETGETHRMKPPKLLDAAKNKLPESVLLGNGTKVNVECSPWSWTMRGKKGVSLNLHGVQVLDLVPYTPTEQPDMFEAQDGFIVDTVNTSETEETQTTDDDDIEL